VIVLGLSFGLLALAGICLARATGVPDESRATRAVRVMIWAFTVLVVTEATLGAGGRLDARSTLAALAAVALALAIGTRRLAPRHASGRPEREPLSVLDVACVFALTAVVLLRAWTGFGKTTFLYDTLSYHLHVPATWLADRRLEIVPAVFGDPSSAYAPSNLELWFAFLMAPLRSDDLAGTGQVAFAALAALAIVAAVREAGGRRTAALAAALLFLLVPEVWQQARTAMTDLGLAALLLASLPFSLRAARRASAGELMTAAAALGLAVGTKYVGLPLALPFALAALSAKAGRPRPAALAAAAAVVFATGGFWYLRNALVTGNPFYPVATLGLPGLTDRAAMRAWLYHLPIGQLGALGEMIGAAGLGFVLAAAVAVVWRRLLPEALLLLALVAVFWLWIPYQESRFLFPAFGVAAVALGRATGRVTRPATGPAIEPISAPLDWRLGVVLVGLVEHSTPERWLLVPAGALGAATAIGWRHLPVPSRSALRSMRALGLGALLVAAAVTLTLGLERHRARDPGYAVGTGLDGAWAWFRGNVYGARVAYTGTNLAFPLAGRDLANRVTYVNVAGAPGDRLHDFGRRLPPTPGRAPNPESAPYRDGASFDVWWRNLRAAHAEVLFVAALDEIVAHNVAADGDGFPVERAWADAHPAQFHLRYASPDARVYGIAP
jgi:4-amino-4-deoxy-L-arabinose transferase-like glycosyltransferase